VANEVQAQLALSASTVKSWFQYRCERKTRYETMTAGDRDAVPILRDVVTAPWAQLGNEFEANVVRLLSTRERVLRPSAGEQGLSQAQSVAFLRRQLTETYAHQLVLEPRAQIKLRLALPTNVSIRRSYPDLVRVEAQGGTPVFTLIDLKATQRATAFHKAQVAFYSLLLESLLQDLGAPGNLSEHGEIWCLPPGSTGDDGSYQADKFRLAPYQRLVIDFFKHEVRALSKKVVTAESDTTFFHIYFKCEQCEYLRHCSSAISESRAAADRDVSAVPGLSHEAKRSLHGLGIFKVGKLAQASGLRAASAQASWTLKRRADLLVARANALVSGTAQRLKEADTYLMPPRVDVGFYLVVDTDPITNTLITLGYLRDGLKGQKIETRIVEKSDPKDERDALCQVMGSLLLELAAIDAHNASHEGDPGKQIYSHLFLYEPSEAINLQEAVARHLDDETVRSGLLNLVRIFPPDDVIPEPEFRGVHHLPATALRSVVEQLFALPVMVSYDLHQVTKALSDSTTQYGAAYEPGKEFKRPFSSRLPIDVCRHLREGTISAATVDADVRARLSAVSTLVRFLIAENVAASQRAGDHEFLRLKKRPFRFQATFDPLNATDLDLLRAFELLENRSGLLNTLVELAQPWRLRLERGRCIAQMTLNKWGKLPSGQHWLAFSVPPESRESELTSKDFDLILTNDDPDIRLNLQVWGLYSARMAPEDEKYSPASLLVQMDGSVFNAAEFQQLLQKSKDHGWFLDKTFKDFTSQRAADFLAYLGEKTGTAG
jgi:predicted RecB family nuclease